MIDGLRERRRQDDEFGGNRRETALQEAHFRASKTLKSPPNNGFRVSRQKLAKLIVEIATGELEDPISRVKRNPVRPGRAGGLKGGRARAQKLTKRKRKEIAAKAATIRWQGRPLGS